LTGMLALYLKNLVKVCDMKKSEINKTIYSCYYCKNSTSVFTLVDGAFVCVDCNKDNTAKIKSFISIKRKPRRRLEQSS
jgi:uncharacterized protein YuzB (UPF0349 family)